MAIALPAAGALVLEALVASEALGNLIFALINQLLAAALAPELAGLQAESFRLNQSVPISAAEAVQAYLRGHYTLDQGHDEAALAGISNSRFDTLAATAGQPLPLVVAMEAWRRGFIPAHGPADGISLEQAIRESDLKNKYIETVKKLQFQLPPVGSIIEGWLRAQITPAEAQDLLYKSGIDKATGELLFKSAGRPPSPQELFALHHRGVIPESGTGGDTLSLEQGYKETDLKDKWYPAWKALGEYRPPPRTITALQRAGAITDAQALKLYREEGLSDELAAVYVKTAHHERSATTRELTKAELVGLYADQAITAAELESRLEKHGYTVEDAKLEIELADLKVERALLQRAINRVGTLYTGRKIDKANAMVTLQGLKLPAAQTARLLQIWSLERGDNLRHLSPAEIGWAVKRGILGVDEGLAELGGLGYGSRDAWLVLAYELKGDPGVPMPSDNLPPV